MFCKDTRDLSVYHLLQVTTNTAPECMQGVYTVLNSLVGIVCGISGLGYFVGIRYCL